MARPTKKTPDREAAIITSLLGGNTRTDSSLAAGISLDTFAVWCKNDPEFHGAVQKAEAEARKDRVHTIVKAAEESWQAAAWMLERRDHEHWGRRDKVDFTMDIRKAIEALTSDPDEVNAAVAEAERLVARR